MKKKLTHFITQYFELSRKEANGFILLCLILLLLILLPAANSLWPPSLPHTSQEDQQTLDSLVALLENALSPETIAARDSSKHPSQLSYTYFDPNHSSEEAMILAGVPAAVSKRIIKFRNKGGVFKRKEDLQKIYGLPAHTYQKLFPYIRLNTASVASRQPAQRSFRSSSPLPSFDLNTADSSDFESLKGIGPVLASRIIKYRNKLGGFVHLQQLEEVYGLDSMIVELLNTRSYIAPGFVPDKININTLEEESFQGHPYLDKKSARWISRYRSQHGAFNSPEQLRNIKTLTEEKLQKIFPYLTTGNY